MTYSFVGIFVLKITCNAITQTTRLSCFGVKSNWFVFVSKLPKIYIEISKFDSCIRLFKRLSKIEIQKKLIQT